MIIQIPIKPERLALLLLPLLAVWLTACRTSAPRVHSTPVFPGMTAGAVAMAFGHPVRMQIHPDGREDWYYIFSTRQRESPPVAETGGTERERRLPDGRGTTITATLVEAPIHLSRAGRVIGPIPAGNVTAK